MADDTYISFYLGMGKIHVFCNTVRAIGEPPYIRFLLEQSGLTMLMEPYDKKEFQSLRVPNAVYRKTGKMEFRSAAFCRLLAGKLGWDHTCSYRIPGQILPKQKLVIFYLTCAFPVESVHIIKSSESVPENKTGYPETI